MADLLSMGECMIEFFAEEPLESAGQFRRAFGGDTLNLIAAAARLGTRVAYLTRVADDAFGRYLLAGWEGEGIDTRFVRKAGDFNGLYFIAAGPDGRREFTYYRRGSAASTIEPADLESVDFGSLRAFHTSGITQALSPSARETVREGLARARGAGCLTSFDINFRPRLWSAAVALDALREALPHVSLLFAGLSEDAAPLLAMRDLHEAAAEFHAMGPPIVVLKEGPQGAWISQQGRIAHVPPRIFGPALDTTGAGDAFAGAFLHALLDGRSPEEAGRCGATCAGLQVMGRGAVASMPAGDEVRRRL